MGKLRWYKRDPVAALDGMSNLSLEERGAYNTVLDLIYARDGAVDDDDRFIAGWLRCDVRVWRRIRLKLIERGKLYAVDGTLRNSRADAEVDRGLSMVASASEAGKASARKRGDVKSKNNEIAQAPAETPVSTNSTSTTTTREDISSLRSDSSRELVARETPDDWPKDFRERFWDRYPRKAGKGAAIRKLEAVRKRGSVTFTALMAGVDRYARAMATVDPQYVKHPATWLNAGCWDDDPAALAHLTGPPGRASSPSFREIGAEIAAGGNHDESPEPRFETDEPAGCDAGPSEFDFSPGLQR